MKKKIITALVFSAVLTISCSKNLSFEQDGLLVPLTVMEDESLPFIDINGIRLHAESFGNKSDPMLVVLHGGPGGDYRGQLNFRQFSNEGFHVVFYDQRGSGLSERLSSDHFDDVQVYIDELDGVIEHYRNSASQKIILAGHSWGAMLAAAYLNQKAEKIAGAIFAEPGGFTWEQTMSYISKSRKLELFSETTNDFVYQDQFITGNDHNTLDYKLALATAGDIGTGDIVAAPLWRFGAICNSSSIELAVNNPEQMDFTTNLKAYEQKTLFAYSEFNEAYGKAHAESVASALSNVEIVEILDCGHEMPHFGWMNLYPIINTYLDQIL